MFLRIARDIAKPQSFAILDLLKRSTGLPVKDLAKALKMSYMGVKQHCVELEKKGLLDTWRRSGEMGRPEKLYRLTAKAAAFYPEAGNEMTLEILQSIQQIYGPSAPDKLLFNHFARKTEVYLKKVKGSSISERATSFAKIRNAEGYCTDLEYDPKEGFRIVEFHHPMKEIAAAFPSIRQMETQMIQKILNTEVQRLEERASGLTKVAWLIPTLGHALAS
jgi:predicted ArsR family transcriptional regulator